MSPEQVVDPGRIIVVDDDLAILRVISNIFAEHNVEVITFATAAPALEYLQNYSADLLLTDVRMPEMSGMELLARVREKDQELPVIIMTGYTEMESAVGAIRQGASDFILKPFEIDYLVHSIEKALGYRALQAAEKKYHLRLESKVRERTAALAAAMADLHQANREVTARLLRLAEYRDVETGAHIRRLGFYANKLAEALDQDQVFVEDITLAAPMHDIGKVGIPDDILLKQGPLRPEEWRIMQTHTLIGVIVKSGVWDN
ncbi:response regulator [Desulfurivibrio alkaliphilus]|uniref:response regulator n=1 Tax=Desulfurivibrio alkaliphilus TaxID=427923 RepID=UPI00067611AB|nr:response regulator [Desulfurivibrio alkaliphilus]